MRLKYKEIILEMEPSQRRGHVSRSPSQTPRSSEKVVRDLRLAEGNMSGRHDKDKGVNVQVIVRCRLVELVHFGAVV